MSQENPQTNELVERLCDLRARVSEIVELARRGKSRVKIMEKYEEARQLYFNIRDTPLPSSGLPEESRDYKLINSSAREILEAAYEEVENYTKKQQ